MQIIQSGSGVLIQPPDLNAFREWNRHKPKALIDKRMTDTIGGGHSKLSRRMETISQI